MLHAIRTTLHRRRPRDAAATTDGGFAMIAVIGWGAIIILIMSLLSGYALSSTRDARRAQDFGAAVTAAQAGVDFAVGQLRAGTALPTVPAWSPWTPVPGAADAEGEGCDTARLNCPRFTYTTQARPDGALDVYAVGDTYSLGKARENVQRAVKVTVRQAGFTDYLYYSEVEAADPADGFAYPRLLYPGGRPECGKRAWPATDARPPDCVVPAWRKDDVTTGSRLHTNDVFATVGSPTFNSRVTTAFDQCVTGQPLTCYRPSAGNPNFGDGDPTYSNGLDLLGLVQAPTDLKAQANKPPADLRAGETEGCVYTGPTRIRFEGDRMRVWSPQTDFATQPHCGSDTITAISAAVSAQLQLSIPGLDATLDQLLGGTFMIPLELLDPPSVLIPKSNVLYVQDTPAGQEPPLLTCFLGKVLGMTGNLDINADVSQSKVSLDACKSGDLFADGDFDGKATVGTDGNILIMSDLKYSDASGSVNTRDGSDRLGLVARGAVEVYNPVQCALALGTCISLQNLNRSLPGNSIEVNAAIMSLEHRFGTQLPVLQPDVYAALNAVVASAALQTSTPTLTLYGSVAQRYRGIIGADLLSVDATTFGINVASLDVNIGYQSKFDYDTHLRSSPPPYFPRPATPTWLQETFAEIPLDKLPSGRPS